MTTELKQAFITAIGETPTNEILKTVAQIGRYGLCTEDEKQDIANDLLVQCLEIIEQRTPTKAMLETYMVTAIRHEKVRIIGARKRAKSSFCSIDSVLETLGDTTPEDEDNLGFDEGAPTNGAFISSDSTLQKILDEDFIRVIQLMDGIEQQILKAIVTEHLPPSAACRKCGKHPMFFTRKVLPSFCQKFKFFCEKK